MMIFLCILEYVHNVIDYIHSVLQDLSRALEILNYVLENDFLLETPFSPTRLAQWVVSHKIHGIFSSGTLPNFHVLD